MKHNQLTARAIEKATKAGYYGDGGGLYLQVTDTGARSWIFRYMVRGKNRDMGLGSFHTFSLKEARLRARECRQQVADGIDPIEARRAKRDRLRSVALENMPFKEAAEKYVALNEKNWTNAKHVAQWKTTLRVHAYPKLADRQVSSIDGMAITDALAGIWLTTPVTASRVKQRIERVCEWVKDGMPLPQQSRAKQHHAAMPFIEVPTFMARLREREGIVARALEFTVLSAARTSEVLGARWDEIQDGTWCVPAIRMKARQEHTVPLSKRLLEILEDLPRDSSGLLFPGAKAGVAIANTAMHKLLDDMAPDYTVHGFRSSFRDWCGDRTAFARDVVEHALAHRIKDKAEAAYRRGSALEKRRKLMEAWSNYCLTEHCENNIILLTSSGSTS
jgi:integrase